MTKDYAHMYVSKEFKKWLRVQAATQEVTVVELTRRMAFKDKEKKREPFNIGF